MMTPISSCAWLIMSVLLLGGCGSKMDSAQQPKPTTSYKKEEYAGKVPHSVFMATVKRVVDGDTIQLEDGTKVRYIGMDTPEKNMPFYREAVEANEKLVSGKEVEVELDEHTTEKNVPWTARTLAYIFVKDGSQRIFVNKFLVENGFAWYYKQGEDKNLKYDDELREAYLNSLSRKNGGWQLWLKEDSSDGFYYATKSGRPFHRTINCEALKHANRENLLKISSKEDAFKSFRKPCRDCYGN